MSAHAEYPRSRQRLPRLRGCSPFLASVLAASFVVEAAIADGGLHQVQSMRHLRLTYATGELHKVDSAARSSPCWSSTRTLGYFRESTPNEVILDWGDLDNDCSRVGSFTITYATDSSAPIDVEIIFYTDENGYGSVGRTPEWGIRLHDLPGGASGIGVYSGWFITVNIPNTLYLTAIDLDADGRGDFGYSYRFLGVGNPAFELAGPIIADADPNVVPFAAPGIEDAYDLFLADPNQPLDPNSFLIPDDNTVFQGTYWYGGNPFAQFYLELRDPNDVSPPIITLQPQTKVLCTGGSHLLSVSAPGATSIAWYKDSQFVDHGTTLAISNADAEADDGIYQAVAFNPGGETHSEYALVAVLDPDELPPVIVPEERVPEPWLGADVQWVKDVSPHNKLDDAIDNDPNLPAEFSIIVNMNTAITQQTLDDLSLLGTIDLVGEYIPSIFVDNVNIVEATTISARPDVAFVELQTPWKYHLDIATQTTKVTSGFYSPCTVIGQHPFLYGLGVNIAIMDSGVDDLFGPGVTHLGLPPALFFYDAATNSYTNPDDTNGHGTHVAGIALGSGFGAAPRGVAPNAGLIDVSIDNARSSQVFNALQTLITKRIAWNVGVINMSFGWDGPSDGKEAYSQLVDYATSLGITVVAAAGNSGTQPMGSPASANGAITVGNSDDQNTANRADDTLRASSQRGPRASNGNAICGDELKPDVTAPGTNIVSTQLNTTGGAVSNTGTSMSAPHVAGLAALLKDAKPSLTPDGIKAVLRQTAEPFGAASNPGCDPIWNNGWGWGLIDASAAVESALNLAPTCGATQLPTDVGFVNESRPYGTTRVETVNPPQLNVPNTIRALVKNFGSATATNVPVRFAIYYITTANNTFYDVGVVVVPSISPGNEVVVGIPWTPRHPAHQCLKAFVEYPADTVTTNNTTQRNITVAHSPVYFRVANLVSQEPIDIDFVAEFETPGSQWGVQFTPPSITLAGGEWALIEALPVPPIGAPNGQMERIWVEARRDDCLLLGGIGIDAMMEDCNGNGIDDWFDILNGTSLDINGDTTPDECDCPADLDHSGAIELPDLAILLSHFGGPGGLAEGDLDLDGDVDLTDLSLMLALYGSFCPS